MAYQTAFLLWTCNTTARPAMRPAPDMSFLAAACKVRGRRSPQMCSWWCEMLTGRYVCITEVEQLELRAKKGPGLLDDRELLLLQ